jgi:hypothetical protein
MKPSDSSFPITYLAVGVAKELFRFLLVHHLAPSSYQRQEIKDNVCYYETWLLKLRRLHLSALALKASQLTPSYLTHLYSSFTHTLTYIQSCYCDEWPQIWFSTSSFTKIDIQMHFPLNLRTVLLLLLPFLILALKSHNTEFQVGLTTKQKRIYRAIQKEGNTFTCFIMK